MRFVHSLSTIPILNRPEYKIPEFYRLVGNIVLSALSVAYIKKFKHKIVLHTDSIGKKILNFLPYDEIYTTLDDIPEYIHPSFFAYGKIQAMENEPLNSIHIDNDVFLKEYIVYDLIENTKYDLLVQHTENGEQYDKFCGFYKSNPEFIKSLGLDPNSNIAYNTGILNFRNQELKDLFIYNYKQIVEHYSKTCFKTLSENSELIPDLFPEQVNIYQISRNYKVLSILDRYLFDYKEFGKIIGYEHLITILKYTKIDYVLDMLSEINPDIFLNTMGHIKYFMDKMGYDEYSIRRVGENKFECRTSEIKLKDIL